LGVDVTIKSMLTGGALAIAVSFAGAAQAQSYIPDWGFADMRQTVAGAFMIAAAAAPAATTPAAAQSNLLNDWGIDDMKQAFANLGVTVTGSETLDNLEDPALYVYGTPAEGMKISAYGVECSGTPLRCRGLNLNAVFALDSNAEVERRVKEIDRLAVAVRNGGDNSLDVSRYVIFDDGITRKNLEVNISVFIGLSYDIWNGGGT
jgi:hypothetical protein